MRFKTELDAGAYNGTKLDTVGYVSQYQHPAVASGLTITGSTTSTGPQMVAGVAGITLAGSWVAVPSTGGPAAPQIGLMLSGAPATDTVTIAITTQIQVDIQFAGVHASNLIPYISGDSNIKANSIRNGGVAQILLDGVPVVGGSVDTAFGTPKFTLLLDGLAHTLVIANTGTHNSSITTLFPAQALVTVGGSNTVLTGLTITESTTQRGFFAASYRIVATAAGTFSLFRTLPGFAETPIVAGLTTGTIYDAANRIGGVSFTVNGTLTTNDSITVVTDQLGIYIKTITLSTGSGSADGSYTTPVIDSGRNDTQWFLAEWDQSTASNAPLPSANIVTGNALINGGTGPGLHGLISQASSGGVFGTTTALTPAVVSLSNTQRGLMGLTSAPVGRYAQLTFTLPSIALATQWMRDFAVYNWVPTAASHPQLLGRLPLPYNSRLGPNLLSLFGTHAVHLAVIDQQVQDFIGSFNVNNAVDQYLLAQGAAFGLTPYSGEPFAAFRNRVTAFYESRVFTGTSTFPGGGSLPFICQQVAQLVNGTLSAVTRTSANGAALTSYTAGGVTVAQTGTNAVTITVPPAPFLGLAGLVQGTTATFAPATAVTPTTPAAQAVVLDYVRNVLRPVTTLITVQFS